MSSLLLKFCRNENYNDSNKSIKKKQSIKHPPTFTAFLDRSETLTFVQ